jgi:enolase-phosphatase E1
VIAQQLLFQSTPAGDLTRRLDGYFDTAIGPKTSPDSYRAILARLGVPAAQTLFVSDVVKELDAARTAGLLTALCVRDAAPLPDRTPHPVVHSFDEI